MKLWKHCLAVTLFAALAGTSVCALAQAPSEPPPPPPPPPPTAPAAAAATPAAAPVTQGAVQWELQVMRDGQQIDAFDGTTSIGQAHTDTHHKVVSHSVGCKDQPAGSIDLSRTITVSPLQVRANLVILSIDAQETLENDAAPSTAEGCRLPPQPRQVNANHPGLVVPDGQWVTWQIVDQNPSLAYRVRATLAPPSASAQ
ncbi:hypothetical protein FAZ97_00530 [Paraburkholderia acidiphila]|uniref:Uncharacterized protein n=1 Tax=Paraburkholderia acidiphila TaxID=2571747 RepID=A0A7Z2G1Z2_9BURK|nr:hypothetical protein [Paraburkholderia acidiphila]QGZ53507.1 hypothetical protein FAZ97_00530 [Paraburkholderia acidiphila]